MLVLVLVLGWLIWCYDVIAEPTLDKLRPADAIVVLGGPYVDNRVYYGRELATEGYAPNLFISVGASAEHATVLAACLAPIRNVTLHCFSPTPATTQGEAQTIGADAKRFGWHRIIVVTSSYHVSRARMLFNRCVDGETLMVASRAHHTFATMAYQFLYQSSAYAKAALIKTSC